MQVSIYLLPDTVQILSQFGNLSEVCDKILQACENGEIDIFNKPSVERQLCQRYNVNIYNPYYLSLVDKYSIKSSRISLTRLVNWFAANEVYTMLDWTASTTVRNTAKRKYLLQIQNICKELYQLQDKIGDAKFTDIVYRLHQWGIDYEAGIEQHQCEDKPE